MSLSEFRDDRFLFFATRNGTVKRTRLDDFDSPRSVLIAINLHPEDELISVAVTDGSQDIVMVSRSGKAIRFSESDARAMGRTAAGVRGMRIDDDDAVLAMAPVPSEGDGGAYLLVVTEQGYGKRTPIDGAGEHGYPRQKRGGQGVKTITVTDTRGGLAGALVVPLEAEILLVSDNGTLIRMALVDVRPMGRSAQGVSLMRPGDGASVVGVALVMEDEEDAEAAAAPVGVEGRSPTSAGSDGGAPVAADVDTDSATDSGE